MKTDEIYFLLANMFICTSFLMDGIGGLLPLIIAMLYISKIGEKKNE